ncbi:hypothetical protein GGS20DRAFT_549192 [Poronia punctata]|nr:hypothetical protein GGS20DRAFT_549192 [Poronia punctata]
MSDSQQPQEPPPIAIIGGGPSGLTLARLLELSKIPYIVFERDESPVINGGGGSLDIHPGTGQEALREAGLIDEFRKLARYDAAVFQVVDYTGENSFSMGKEEEEEGGGGGGMMDRPEIDRAQLRGLLLDSIPREKVLWGKKVVSVERNNEKEKGKEKGWEVRFEDGETKRGFRFLVGADGAWSKVRGSIIPTKPIYSGRTILEGRLPPPSSSSSSSSPSATTSLVGKGTLAVTGDGVAMTVQQMSDQSYRVYAYISCPEIAVSSLSEEIVLFGKREGEEGREEGGGGRFQDFKENIRALLENAEGPWRKWPLYYLDPEIYLPFSTSTTSEKEEDEDEGGKRWKYHVPGLVLLGDAAHVGLPNGEGVNLGMLDALTFHRCLVDELGKEEDQEGGRGRNDEERIERAVLAYERDMCVRAYGHIVDGMMMTDMMCSADGAKRMADMFRQAMGMGG